VEGEQNKIMKKQLLIAIAFLGFQVATFAQSNASGTASQTMNLALSNALEIKFNSNNSTTGSTVTLPFTTVNDFQNGVTSTDINLYVRSNKGFSVTVNSSSSQFTYSGTATQNTSMSVSSVLGIMVTSNNTGGTIGNQFSSSSYNFISQTSKTLLQNCTYGGNQNFTIKYKATPGFNNPAGTYSTDVIYTATQQ
jgi:Tfp pilus assembly protein PilV